MKLAGFDVLSFDCYGTLIDWESGIYTALQPLLSRAGIHLTRDQVLQAFARHESAQQAKTPSLSYPEILSAVHRQLAIEWGAVPNPAEASAFGASVANWPPFPDTVEALTYLKRHFQLVILSNIDRASFQQTNRMLSVEFDAIYTAQDIGSYKPDPRNFAYMLDRLAGQGIPPHRILHVAQSLFHDHVPANAVGLASAWIDRRHDAPPNGGATAPASPDVRYDFRFISLGALVEAHQAG
jgi:2-haloalkanoic acid dehalogenase type II